MMKSNVKKAMAAIAAAVVCAIPMTNAVTASAASGLRRDTGIRTAETASGTGMKGADAIPAATTTTGRARKVSMTTTTAEVTLGQSGSVFTPGEDSRIGIETADIGDRYDSQIRDEVIRGTKLIDYQAIDSSRRVCTHDGSCRSDDEKLRRPRHEIVK